MKVTIFKNDETSAERLRRIKSEYGITYTEQIKRGLFLLDKELSSTNNELGKAYQRSLKKCKN